MKGGGVGLIARFSKVLRIGDEGRAEKGVLKE